MKYIIDTDTITLFRKKHSLVVSRLRANLIQSAASVISVDEELSGWYSALKNAKDIDKLEHFYNHPADVVRFYASRSIISFSKPAILRYQHLHSLKLNVRKNDLRIAAIAIEAGAIIVTRIVRDFARVPGLVVEDWAAP